MAGQAAVILLGQPAIWLVAFYVGYALLIWPVTDGRDVRPDHRHAADRLPASDIRRL
jgi:hypothetical protein